MESYTLLKSSMEYSYWDFNKPLIVFIWTYTLGTVRPELGRFGSRSGTPTTARRKRGVGAEGGVGVGYNGIWSLAKPR